MLNMINTYNKSESLSSHTNESALILQVTSNEVLDKFAKL